MNDEYYQVQMVYVCTPISTESQCILYENNGLRAWKAVAKTGVPRWQREKEVSTTLPSLIRTLSRHQRFWIEQSISGITHFQCNEHLVHLELESVPTHGGGTHGGTVHKRLFGCDAPILSHVTVAQIAKHSERLGRCVSVCRILRSSRYKEGCFFTKS